jgi:hypothetical protein
MKPLPVLLICLLASGCQEPPSNIPRSPDEYRAREDCLYRTLCQEIRERGKEDLEGVASYASAACQIPVSREKSQQVSSPEAQPAGETSEERVAQIEFDWHAMAVAQQLKDRCGASP